MARLGGYRRRSRKEPGLIETMYTADMAAYKDADQKRFELTSDVWIDILEEVSPN